MTDTATATAPRYLRCTCGHVLGTIARERRGPVTLTPAPDTRLHRITTPVVWLQCPCGVVSPWFVASGRGTMPPAHGTL